MKINYEDIITKANARKEKLQELATYTEAIQEKYADLELDVQFFNDLIHKIKALDNEGQLMVSKNITILLSDATTAMKQLTHGAIRNEFACTPLKNLVNALSV